MNHPAPKQNQRENALKVIVISKSFKNKSLCNLIRYNNFCIQCLSLISLRKQSTHKFNYLVFSLLYMNSNFHGSFFQILLSECERIKSAIPRASLKRTHRQRKWRSHQIRIQRQHLFGHRLMMIFSDGLTDFLCNW